MKTDLETYRKFTFLRDLLQQISQISFTYGMTNKRYPIDRLNNQQLQELIKLYEDLINRIKNLNVEYENSNNLDKNL